MSEQSRMAVFGSRFVRHLWSLGRVYWGSADARWGGLLLGLAVLFELGAVWGSLRVADAEREILDSLAGRQSAAFFAAVGVFLAVTFLFLFSSAYRIYIRQALEIRWRRALTAHCVNGWIGPRAYVEPELHPEVDNPDQRIQEDVRDFVASALGLSLSLLAAVATLASFGGLLWTLSARFPIPLGASEHFHLPGSMLWVAVAYGLVSTLITHRVGRRLVPINFDRLRVEADFRYGLTHFRDNAEAVALSCGEEAERGASLVRFGAVIRNWWALIQAQRNLTLVTGAIGQANNVVPVLVAAPAYFVGAITLGTIVQIRIAYGQVSGALAWFVSAYQEIARWRASIERLSSLAEAMDDTTRRFAGSKLHVSPGDDGLRLDGLRLEEPNGRVLLDGASARVDPGDRLVITGPSGTGKTLLLRAIAGIWPFGAGRIEVPAGARMMFVTQRPYLPIGTLRAAISYPAPGDAFADARIRQSLQLLQLDRLEGRLDEVAQWEQLLSPHEQQRLALVRVLLHAPDWIFLDKSTSALDEENERQLYALIAERLPGATLVSIAHRVGVEQYHARRWSLAPRDGRVVLEAA